MKPMRGSHPPMPYRALVRAVLPKYMATLRRLFFGCSDAQLRLFANLLAFSA